MTITGIIDLDTGDFVENINKERINSISVQESAALTLELSFYDGGQEVTDASVLAAKLTALTFEAKSTLDSSASSLVTITSGFLSGGSGLTRSGTINFNTTDINTALGSEEKIKLYGQLKTTYDGVDYLSQLITTTVHNDVIGDGGAATPAVFPRLVTSTSNPTVNDDTGDGYGVGTLWVNTNTPAAFVLISNSAGAANWDLLSEGTNLTADRAVVSDGSGVVSASAVTSTELGYLDGVSSAIQTQLDTKQATITGAATTIDTEDLTASRALASNGSGKIEVSAVTSTELGYLDGVTSAIQTQLDAKQATITGAATSIVSSDFTPNLAVITDGSGKIHSSSTTATEISRVSGVTSGIQGQLDAKQAKPSEGAFEDGDKTKLDGIDTSADVTDATTVAAAGALMDSELTDLAGVKGVTISTLQVKPSEGAFANGDKTKLDAIEENADVTDATNVESAGALMKSGGTMTGAITCGSGGINANYNTISNLSDGSSAQDAVTKTQLDSVSSTASSAASTASSANTTANAALPKSGGTMTGTITCGSSGSETYIYYPNLYEAILSANLDAKTSYKMVNLAAGTANGDSLRWEQLRTIANTQTGTTYTLVVGDATKTVRLNNASTVTVTVPKSVFVAGDTVTLFRKGAGGVTIEPVDSDVTINSVGTKRKLAYQYSAATLICVTGGGTPEFDLIGDLTT